MYDIHTDHLDTPRVITDSSGTEVWRWDSAPFGETLPNEQPTNATSKFTFNIRFAGQYFDQETGLHYNYFRDYDPRMGRYVESDPIGLAGGMTTYGYVGANPVKFVDSRGLQAFPGGIPWAGFDPYKQPMSTTTPSVDDACVQKYIHDNYGDLGGFITEIGNLQQFSPGANPDFLSAVKEGLMIADEKLVLTKGPGAIGTSLMKFSPASLSLAYEAGSRIAAFGGLASGTLEIAGAFMTPFATTAMAKAREACSCQKK
ncbi:RHS repeat domain-containing protein [Undibacterium sp. TJN19]|uniref:RHS repeat domain-containing protein n=1 Tax=Undibacterium sp. TJN19 TaxID=3413055 RepID=UPI003BF0F596